MTDTRHHHCNLNIRYDQSDEQWNKLSNVYENMPGWIGYANGIPYWFGKEEQDVFVTASVEPSGLAFHAQLSDYEWEVWIEHFKSEATKALGYIVGEPEDGFL